MTGPERETLSQALKLQRDVLVSLDAFRGELLGLFTDLRREVMVHVDDLDTRLTEVERAELSSLSEVAGVARFVAHNEAVKEKRGISFRGWLTVAAALGGAVAGIVVKVLDVVITH